MKRVVITVVVLGLSIAAGAEPGPLLFPNSDFEQGDLTNWITEGTAFAYQPTKGDNVKVRTDTNEARPQGEYWAGTYERYQGKAGQRPGGSQSNRPTGGLISEGFIINHPYITFLVGGGRGEDLAVKLIVGGTVERVAHGHQDQLLRRVYWDVSEFQNRKAMIYIIDHSSLGWGIINADDFRFADSNPHRLVFDNSDFEQGGLSNWKTEGPAFEHQPTKGDNVAARTNGSKQADPQGMYWVGSHEKYRGESGEEAGTAQGDEPQGVLKSIEFKIEQPVIAFRVGGGDGENTSVRLIVEGAPIHTTHGMNDPRLWPAVWNLYDHVGKDAFIEILDQSSEAWGHISADNFHYARAK